jgi:hypothetical protein
MKDLWKLQLFTRDGQCIEICGSEETLRIAQGEVKAEFERIKGIPGEEIKGFIEVNGIWDSADRAETSLLLQLNTISGCRLLQIY